MHREGRKFVDLYLDGERLSEDVDDFVDEWHQGGTGVPLYEFLGFTHDEYKSWVECPDSIDLILAGRANPTPLEETFMFCASCHKEMHQIIGQIYSCESGHVWACKGGLEVREYGWAIPLAAEIDRLRALNAELVGACQPFSRAAATIPVFAPDDHVYWHTYLKASDWRRVAKLVPVEPDEPILGG